MNNSQVQNWQELVELELQQKKIADLKILYTSLDLPKDYESLPGFYPYTRGIKASMYAGKPWTIRQYAGFSQASESNAFYKHCLASGQKGLSVAFDLPTHRGYDSDDEEVAGDVGKAGVAIDSVEDMNTLFADIDLSKISVSMTMNGAVLPVLAAFLVNAYEQGVEPKDISGTIQNDILKEFMVRNTFIYAPSPSMRIVADIMEYCAKNLPKFNSISISGYHIHEAGADLALELGLTLANGVEYVGLALKRGLELDSFAPRISFFFATGMNFFMEIAKLRAARTLWAQIMLEFGAKDPKSSQLRTHCQTSGWSLAEKDPFNNIVRTSLEAMAAVLGGTQSLHTNSFDEAIALPTKTSSRIALNTQLILQHESKVCDVIDPLAGSYYVESLTNSLIKSAKEIMGQIKKVGGMTKAIDLGLPMLWIEEAALKRQALIDSGQEIIVGVNKYELKLEADIDTLNIDNHKVIAEQKRNLAKLKNKRSKKLVAASLAKLKEGARSDKNLLELSIDAMKARATLGEVSLALEEVFGRFEPKARATLGVYKSVYGQDNQDIDELLLQVKQFAKNAGRQPRILVAKLGQDGHDRGARVIASAFSDFGFDVDLSPLFQSPHSIAKQALDNDVHIIGVSTLAGGHKTLVPKLLDELKALNALEILVVVGGVVPKKDAEELVKLGVAQVFGPGTNIVHAAKKVLSLLKHDN